MVPQLVQTGDWGFCEDLKSGYWQIPLNEDHKKLFGCCVDGVYYEANVLILGITDAVFAFTVIIRPILRYLRSLGYRCLGYIDDCFGLAASREGAMLLRQQLLEIFRQCGLMVNVSKSKPVSQCPLFLGLHLDTLLRKFIIPSDKVDRFLREANFLLRNK